MCKSTVYTTDGTKIMEDVIPIKIDVMRQHGRYSKSEKIVRRLCGGDRLNKH